MSSTTSVGVARQRSTVKAVALPAEHGGWGLTAEPVLLGLLVAPSWAGLALGAAAMTAFVARTPIKVGLGDLRRGRRLDRTGVALIIGVAELVLLAALATTAVLLSDQPFWTPLLVAAVAAVAVPELLGGAAAIIAVVLAQRVGAVRPAPSAIVVGIRQSVLGVAVVVITWLGVVLTGGLP